MHISTDYVYGTKYFQPITIGEHEDPCNYYGLTKSLGENEIIKSDCEYLIFRTSWLYSEFCDNFVTKIYRKLTEAKDNIIEIPIDQIGSPTYACDLGKFLFDIIENGFVLNKKGIYHYANKGVATWYDIASEIQNFYGNNDIEIQYKLTKRDLIKRPSYSVLDTVLTEKDFNIKIKYWRNSLLECLNQI